MRQLVKVLSGAIENLKTHFPDGAKTIYAEVIHPYQGWIGITLLVVVGDSSSAGGAMAGDLA